MKSSKKKVIAFMLLLSMIVSMMPVRTAHAYKYIITPQGQLPPAPLRSYSSNGVRMRGTTIAFVAETILVDISEYTGNIYQAYNEVQNTFYSNCKPDYGAGDMWCIEKGNVTYYVIDTIDTGRMKTRYFGGDSKGAPLVSLAGSNKGYAELREVIGCIMDSPDMNKATNASGSATGFFVENYLGDDPSGEIQMIIDAKKAASSVESTLRIPIYKVTDGSLNSTNIIVGSGGESIIEGDIEDICKRVSYNWSQRDMYQILTFLTPIIVPTFEDCGGHILDNIPVSLVLESAGKHYLMDNAMYISQIAYQAYSSTALANGTYSNIFGKSTSGSNSIVVNQWDEYLKNSPLGNYIFGDQKNRPSGGEGYYLGTSGRLSDDTLLEIIDAVKQTLGKAYGTTPTAGWMADTLVEQLSYNASHKGDYPTLKRSLTFNEFAVVCATMSGSGFISTTSSSMMYINEILRYFYEYPSALEIVEYKDKNNKTTVGYEIGANKNLSKTGNVTLASLMTGYTTWIQSVPNSSSASNGLYCAAPSSGVHNISNILRAKTYCMGVHTDGTGNNAATLGDLEIKFHNASPVWAGARLPFYGKVSNKSGETAKFYALPFDITNADITDDTYMWLVKDIVDGMNTAYLHLNTSYYQLSATNGLFNEKLKVYIEKTDTGYLIKVTEQGVLADGVILSFEDSSDTVYTKVCEAINSGDKTAKFENVDEIEEYDGNKEVLIKSIDRSKNIYFEFEIPFSNVTEDIEIKSYLKISDITCYTKGLDTATTEKIKETEIIKSMEITPETNDGDLPEEVTSVADDSKDWVITTISADAPPVVIEHENGGEIVTTINAGGAFNIYEGLSVKLYPRFTEKPAGIKESDSYTITCPDGTKITGEKYSNLNNDLKNSCSYILETYDTKFETDSSSKKIDDIEWQLKMGSYECKITMKVTVHKWNSKISLSMTEPASDTVSIPAPVEVTGVTKVTRGEDDKESNAVTTGSYKAVHNISTDSYLRSADIDVDKTYVTSEVTNESAVINFKEGRSKFSDVNFEYQYSGILSATGEKWTVKDTVDVYTLSLVTGDYRKAFSFEGETFINLGESIRVPARFDKGQADPMEGVVLSTDYFNPEDYGFTVDEDTSLYIITEYADAEPGSAVVTKKGDKVYLSSTIKFSKEGEYLVGGFSITDGNLTVGLTGDITNTTNPYGVCRVPKDRTAMNPIKMEIGDGDREYDDDGNPGTKSFILQRISFTKTREFSEWSSLVAGDKEVELTVDIADSTYGGKGSIANIRHTFSSKVSVEISDDNRSLTVKGTGADMISALTLNPVIEFDLVIERVMNRPIVMEVLVSAEGVLSYKYSTTKDKVYVSPLDANYTDVGANTVEPKDIPIFCEEWTLTTEATRPVAVLTATLPKSNNWQWDVLSGIPNTEALSATVGADLFKIGLGMRTHAMGIPLASDSVLADDSDGNYNTQYENATIVRTITINVTADKYWGTTNPPCTLSCSTAHPISTGGTTKTGGQSVSDTLKVSAGPGESVSETKTLSCPGAERWECPKCSFVHEEHAAHDMVMSASANNPLCNWCTNGCPGHGVDEDENPLPCTCTKCTCKPSVSSSDSASCNCKWSHDCTWKCTYNCSTGVATVTGGNGATAECTPEENAHNQLLNSGTVTVTQEEEVVTGSHTNNTLIDSGYTVGLGCECDKKTNCIHPSTTKRTYKVVETVDAIAWTSIENLYVNLLEGATIDVADDVFITGTEGRTVLNSGAEFSIWRGDDSSVDDICEDGNLNTPGRGNTLVGTGRIYFTEFPSPTYATPYGSTSITTGYAGKLNVTIDMKIIADSQIGDQSDVLEVDAYPEAVDNRGSLLEHYQEVTSSSTEYKSKPGDWLSSTQADNLTAQAANAWLFNNNQKMYKVNIVSDAMSVKYGLLNQNIIGYLASFGNPISLFNAPFDDEHNVVYRNHASGFSSLIEMGNIAMFKGKISDLVGGKGIFRNGYTGTYAPAENSAAMYAAQGEQTSPGNLVEALGSGTIDQWNAYGNTLFNRTNTVPDNPYKSTGENYLGYHKGYSAIEGNVEITLQDDYYGKAVDTVSGDTKLVMYMDGAKIKEIEGVALLPMNTGDVVIDAETQLSFLGLHLKEDSVNSVIKNGLEISCSYTNMIKFVFDNETEDTIEEGAVDSKELCFASTEELDTRRINSFIIHNPLAVSTTILGNKWGACDTVYSYDESNEDDRMACKGMSNEDKDDYIVIGNTFILWVSNFMTEGNAVEVFNTGLSTLDWGAGEACDTMTGEAAEGNHGFGKYLNTSQWVGHNTVEFGFPVSYIDINGNYIRAEANTEIDLTKVKAKGDAQKPDDSFAEGVNRMYGTPYEFTLELSAEEMNLARYVVRAYAKDIPSGAYPYSIGNNSTDRSVYVANDSVFDTGLIDIVGRIGDVVLTDAQDYRYSNLFWEPLNEWLIPDVIKKASVSSYYSVRPKNNILMQTTSPVIGTLKQDLLSKVGITVNRVDLPLCGNINNITEFKKNNLGLGYSVYASVSTIGKYTGVNPDCTYPTTYLDEGVIADTRYNTLNVIPIYVLYDKDTGEFYDIDLFAGSGTDYLRYYTSKGFSANYTNSLYVEVDDELEQSRYCISDFAKYYSLCFNDNASSMFTDKTYVGTAGKIVLDERSNMVIGTKVVDSIPQSYNLDTSTFTFNNNIVTYDAATDGKQSNADYAQNHRRWVFNLGLPSSTIATYPDVENSAIAIVSSNKKLLDEHPNSVIVCFVRLIANGSVNTLEYDFVRANGGSTINIDGISVDYLDKPVYINDTIEYTLMSTYTPLFVNDVVRTSTDDLGIEGTH